MYVPPIYPVSLSMSQPRCLDDIALGLLYSAVLCTAFAFPFENGKNKKKRYERKTVEQS